MNARNLLAGVAAVLTINLITYLALAFVTLDWNVLNWGWPTRCALAISFMWSMGQLFSFIARIKRNG